MKSVLFAMLACVPSAFALTVFDANSPGGMRDFSFPGDGPAFSHTAGAGWQATNSLEEASAFLESPLLRVTSPGDLEVALRHSWNFEYGDFDAFDGGQLNLSVNGSPPTLFNGWTGGGYTSDIDGVDGLFFEPGWSATGTNVLSTGRLPGLAVGDTIRLTMEAGWDPSDSSAAPNWTLHSLDVAGVEMVAGPDPASFVTVFDADGPDDGAVSTTGLAPDFTFHEGLGWGVRNQRNPGRSELKLPAMTVRETGSVFVSLDHVLSFGDRPSEGAQLLVSVNGSPSVVVREWIVGGYQSGMVEALTGDSGWAGGNDSQTHSVAFIGEFAANDALTFTFVAAWQRYFSPSTWSWIIGQFGVSNILTPYQPDVPQVTVNTLPDGRVRVDISKRASNVSFLQRLAQDGSQWEWTGHSTLGTENAIFDPAVDGRSAIFRAVTVFRRPDDFFALLPVGNHRSEVVVFDSPPGIDFSVEGSTDEVEWTVLGNGTTSAFGAESAIGRLLLDEAAPEHARVAFHVPSRAAEFDIPVAVFSSHMAKINGPYFLRFMEDVITGPVWDAPDEILDHFRNRTPPADARPGSEFVSGQFGGVGVWLAVGPPRSTGPGRVEVDSGFLIGDAIEIYLHTVELIGGEWTVTSTSFHPPGR